MSAAFTHPLAAALAGFPQLTVSRLPIVAWHLNQRIILFQIFLTGNEQQRVRLHVTEPDQKSSMLLQHIVSRSLRRHRRECRGDLHGTPAQLLGAVAAEVRPSRAHWPQP